MTIRRTLTRLLLNQALRPEQSDDAVRALTLYERMIVVAPEEGKGWWELARLRLVAGSLGRLPSLTSMLEIMRGGGQRAHIVAMLEAIA